jgi:hypothetical protein
MEAWDGVESTYTDCNPTVSPHGERSVADCRFRSTAVTRLLTPARHRIALHLLQDLLAVPDHAFLCEAGAESLAPFCPNALISKPRSGCGSTTSDRRQRPLNQTPEAIAETTVTP